MELIQFRLIEDRAFVRSDEDEEDEGPRSQFNNNNNNSHKNNHVNEFRSNDVGEDGDGDDDDRDELESNHSSSVGGGGGKKKRSASTRDVLKSTLASTRRTVIGKISSSTRSSISGELFRGSSSRANRSTLLESNGNEEEEDEDEEKEEDEDEGRRQARRHQATSEISTAAAAAAALTTVSSSITNSLQATSRRAASESRDMCCNRKCVCLILVAMFLAQDILINLYLVSDSFVRLPTFAGFRMDESLVDMWLVSLVRDSFMLVVLAIFGVRHRLVHSFVKCVHKKYVSSFMCLAMYSYAMIKMLLHADQRALVDKRAMTMYAWNILAAFVFFIAWYMMSLLKPKECNYQKTDVDGGDMGENGGAGDEDIFIETLKETKKKRSSLFRLFKYSGPDVAYIALGTLFLLAGAICEAFVPYYTGQVLDAILVQKDFTHFKNNAVYFISAHFASGAFGGLRTCMFSISVSRLNVRLRRYVFKALIEQDIGFFDKVKTGDMLSRLSADTTTMSDLISQNLNGFLWNLVKTIGTLAFILKLSWQLSLTCIIGAPVIFAIGKLFGSYHRNLSFKVQKFMAEANHVAEGTTFSFANFYLFNNFWGPSIILERQS